MTLAQSPRLFSSFYILGFFVFFSLILSWTIHRKLCHHLVTLLEFRQLSFVDRINCLLTPTHVMLLRVKRTEYCFLFNLGCLKYFDHIELCAWFIYNKRANKCLLLVKELKPDVVMNVTVVKKLPFYVYFPTVPCKPHMADTRALISTICQQTILLEQS